MKILKKIILSILCIIIYTNQIISQNSKFHTTFKEDIIFKNNSLKLISFTTSENRIKIIIESNISFIGEVTIIKIHTNPDWYILGTLYIEPNYRNKGYAKFLIQYIIDFLKKEKADTLFLEAGPFEKINGTYRDLPQSHEYLIKLELLKKLYKKCGFEIEQNPKVIKHFKNALNTTLEIECTEVENLMSYYLTDAKKILLPNSSETFEELFDSVFTLLIFENFF